MERNGTTYSTETPAAVVDALENARASGARIRVFYGDAATGKSWHEEHDVLGRIGRSMGAGPNPMRVPLMIANARSSGGPALLDSCIVAIATAPGRFTYRHPTLDLGAWTVAPSDEPGYCESAIVDGTTHANFRKPGQAARFVAFMLGERFAK
jgi:hypothetical protein